MATPHESAPPASTVAPDKPRYSKEEQARYQAIFAPTAAEYRRWDNLSSGLKGWLAGLVALSFLELLLLPKSAAGWLGVPVGLFFATIFYITYKTLGLKCPACHGELGYGHGVFCPQCASADVDSGSDFRLMHCPHCAMSMQSGGKRTARNYRIRACTHCGLWLDDQGL